MSRYIVKANCLEKLEWLTIWNRGSRNQVETSQLTFAPIYSWVTFAFTSLSSYLSWKFIYLQMSMLDMEALIKRSLEIREDLLFTIGLKHHKTNHCCFLDTCSNSFFLLFYTQWNGKRLGYWICLIMDV